MVSTKNGRPSVVPMAWSGNHAITWQACRSARLRLAANSDSTSCLVEAQLLRLGGDVFAVRLHVHLLVDVAYDAVQIDVEGPTLREAARAEDAKRLGDFFVG